MFAKFTAFVIAVVAEMTELFTWTVPVPAAFLRAEAFVPLAVIVLFCMVGVQLLPHPLKMPSFSAEPPDTVIVVFIIL